MATVSFPRFYFRLRKCFIQKALTLWFYFTWLFLLNTTGISAQGTLILTLDKALEIASEQSLQTFLNKHYYMADYWAYRSYRANLLPSVNLRANPLSYTNASRLRYNSVTQTDEFIRTENLTSDLNLSMLQNLPLTGGTFFVQSALDRVENFGKNSFTQYSSVPFRIGYQQQIFGFNALKWQMKLEPLKFEKAKKEYLESVEGMHVNTVRYFFAMIYAKMQREMAQANMENTVNLLEIAEKRNELGTVTPEELLDMRLSMNNAAIAYQEALMRYRETKDELMNFLMLPVEIEMEISLPTGIPVAKVDIPLVLQQALENNPEISQMEQRVLETIRNVEEAKASRHFQADIFLTYGISKDDGDLLQSGKPLNVYSPDFNNYQRYSVGINIPLVDWGRNKGRYQMARSQQEIAEVSAQQARQRFEQTAVTSAVSFNLQKDRIEAAALSDSLAMESYELTMTRFRAGRVNVLQLTSSQVAKDRARVQYIQALAEYWISYYTLRRLTLYDFENDRKLEFREEELFR